ncbi:MAG: tRNA-guanine transglycosylase DpdA [Brevundimonas sp.]|uniref:tRNA-guanine transglycosylase DpdA n=1 Tax=Brevundimonas sp. TaxID=1871086 RepID=UPI00248A6C7C|nr:tRNA-guanine transglycosylase DpdA [Brevundimonas sp.]MDI1328247.1 tRNA-guanine transglycosylase DpdA [Brevundimonas sp.]
MKFIFADSLDFVDPGYDFLNDRNAPGRKPYWDDAYPHEILGYAPYHGMLVSRGIVGDGPVKGKYTEAQSMRFRRVGAREFLRLDKPEFVDLALFGDCGAFTYVKEDKPPYTPADTVEFYDDCGFTHGCSVDHIIFDFDETVTGMEGGSAEARRRFDITLENAAAFRDEAGRGGRFTPMGVIQGWSPASMAEAARRLVAMGYDYLAIGGMVPLKAEQIKRCLVAIRDAVPTTTRLHILGFAKANEIHEFAPFNVTSIDTTSPLLRAFKDDKQNYWLGDGPNLTYYTAIRIPQAIENPRLQAHVRQGDFKAEELTRLEVNALAALRAYDHDDQDLEGVLETVLAYNAVLATGQAYEDVRDHRTIEKLRGRYRTTLADKPWRKCGCRICKDVGIEVMIFRASNRNKRRGIHNLAAFKTVVNALPSNRDQSL